MNADLGIVRDVAFLLLLVVVARIVAGHVPGMPWRLAGYSLLATAVGAGALLLAGAGLEIRAALAAIAILEGIYWHGLVTPHVPVGRQRHALLAASAAFVAAGILALAVVHRWWMAPVGLVLVTVAGAGWHALPEALRRPRRRPVPVVDLELPRDRAALERAVQGTGQPVGRAPVVAPPSPRPPTPSAAPAPALVALACPSCGLAGKVPAVRAGQVLPCPRCKAPVQVPGGAPARPAEKRAARPAAKAAPAPKRKGKGEA